MAEGRLAFPAADTLVAVPMSGMSQDGWDGCNDTRSLGDLLTITRCPNLKEKELRDGMKESYNE